MPTNLARFALLVCLLCAVLPGSAHAQTVGRVVVLPYTLGQAEPAYGTAEAVEAALTGRRAKVISMHEARDRFHAKSRPPSAPTSNDLDVMAREARNAIEHVAFGRSQAAQRSVREVLTRAERSLESLNRETSAARHVLDACLALVRNELQKEDRREALEQAMACRRLVPDVGPNENLHPASVIGVLAEADDQLRRMRIGRLSVESVPRSACAVYLNGRHLGSTPFVLDRASAGTYGVQVECGRTSGRVHLVELGEQPVDLQVDTEFDSAIASEPRLLLRYDSQDPIDRQVLVRHGSLAGDALRADDVILVGVEGNRLQLLRVFVKQARMVGSYSMPWDPTKPVDRTRLELALDVLSEARFAEERPVVAAVPVATAPSVATTVVAAPGDTVAVSQAAPNPAAEPEPAVASSGQRERGWTAQARRRLGGVAAGVGAVGFGVGVYFERRRADLDREIAALATDDPSLRAKDDSFQTARSLRWVGLGGAFLSALSVPLLSKPRASVPWWSWAAGGAGIALAGVGVWQVAIASQCELPTSDGGCIATKATEGRGALLLGASVVALTVPFTHLLLRERAQLAVHTDGSDLQLSLRVRH